MSYVDGSSQFAEMPVAFAEPDVRVDFIRKTYLNLALAIAGFAAITAILLQIPLTQQFCEKMLHNPMLFLVSIGGMLFVEWIATRWAASSPSIEVQYAGLALYTVGEAIFFLPILYMAHFYVGADVIPTAGAITLLVFGGLTASVFLTGADFSFLRSGLTIASMAAMGLILCSFIFGGFSLGLLFSVAMVALAAGYILYYTSNVLHHYPVGMHVAAALALFAAVMLLFWYVLQILMRMRR